MHAHFDEVAARMNSNIKWIVGFTYISVAIIGSAWSVNNVVITLAGQVRGDLHDLRETLERVACGEFAALRVAREERHDPSLDGSLASRLGWLLPEPDARTAAARPAPCDCPVASRR